MRYLFVSGSRLGEAGRILPHPIQSHFSPLQPIHQLTSDLSDFTEGSTSSLHGFKSTFFCENIVRNRVHSVVLKYLTENDVTVPRRVDVSTNSCDDIFKPILCILVSGHVNASIILNPTPDLINPIIRFKIQVDGFQLLIRK